MSIIHPTHPKYRDTDVRDLIILLAEHKQDADITAVFIVTEALNL